jgi:FtsZ-interacting cell division protein YlmF
MSTVFERTPQDYTDYMNLYFEGMQRMHDQHETALGRSVAVHEVAAAHLISQNGFPSQQSPDVLPFLFQGHATKVIGQAAEQARDAYGAVEEASFVLRAIADARDRQIYDGALNAFRAGNRDNAFKYIDEHASSNDARRALRTAMDLGVAESVQFASRSLPLRDKSEAIARAAEIKNHVRKYASADRIQAPLRGVGFKEVAQSVLSVPSSRNFSNYAEFIDTAAHSPEANDLLYTLRDVTMLKQVDALIGRGYYTDQPYNLIDKLASNETIRKAAYAYTKQAFARQEREQDRLNKQRAEREQQERDRQEQRRQQAEHDRQERARRQQHTTRNATPPRQENSRILSAEERVVVQTAIAGVRGNDYKEIDRIKKSLNGEKPGDVLDVISMVKRLRQEATDAGKAVPSDRAIYVQLRKTFELVDADKKLVHQFQILSNLMGGKVNGKLPF